MSLYFSWRPSHPSSIGASNYRHFWLLWLVLVALPLLYPFSLQAFKLPFGLLPSAGKISLTNYYFYRNLVIEMGVLLPLFCSTYLSFILRDLSLEVG